VVLLVIGAATALAVGASAAAPPPTVGPIPPSAFQPGQPLRAGLVPDFVPALDRAGNIAGYVRGDALTGEPGTQLGPVVAPTITVYAADLTTIVGYMIPDKGFVAVGVDPRTIQGFPVHVGPAGAVASPAN